MTQYKRLLSQLNDYKVRFIIIGGVAAVYHGSSYNTFDLDMCYDRSEDNLNNIVQALTPINPRLRDVPDEVYFVLDFKALKNGLNFSFSTDFGDLDLFGEVLGVGTYKELITDAENTAIYDRSIYILDLNSLITAKETVRRQKDEAVIQELRAIRELRENK